MPRFAQMPVYRPGIRHIALGRNHIVSPMLRDVFPNRSSIISPVCQHIAPAEFKLFQQFDGMNTIVIVPG